jgi:phenylpropionate dioxygenase-like ring-hydroxylating dioxygenase large terminal subunit
MEAARGAFDMRNHWYPVAFASELSATGGNANSRPTDPYGFQLLGDPIVLFRDQHGAAQCVQDKCSHRSAPLSVGTVRDGRLECKVPKYMIYYLLFYYFIYYFLSYFIF